MRSSQSSSWYLLQPVVIEVQAKFHSASAAASWPCSGPEEPRVQAGEAQGVYWRGGSWLLLMHCVFSLPLTGE